MDHNAVVGVLSVADRPEQTVGEWNGVLYAIIVRPLHAYGWVIRLGMRRIAGRGSAHLWCRILTAGSAAKQAVCESVVCSAGVRLSASGNALLLSSRHRKPHAISIA